MPPSIYKPLAIPTGLQGPPEGTFNTPQITFDQYDKLAAMQKAQELANSQNQLKFNEAQDTVAKKKAIEDALAAKFGGMDPNDPNFNPDIALQIAQKVALQNHDLDTALNIEKVQKERRAGATPLTEGQRKLFETALGGQQLPPEATTQDIAILGAIQRGNTYAQAVGETKDRRSDTIHSYAPGGYEADINPETGQGPTKTDGQKFTAHVTAHDRINNDLDLLESSFSRSDPNDPTAPEFQFQKGLLGDIQIALKEKNNFGAALTANEERMNNASNPTVLARPDVGIAKALTYAGLGRTPEEAINNMRVMLGADMESEAFRYKFRRTQARPQPSFSPDYNAPDVSGAMGRAGAQSPDAGTPQPPRPGLVYGGVDQATGLTIWKKG